MSTMRQHGVTGICSTVGFRTVLVTKLINNNHAGDSGTMKTNGIVIIGACCTLLMSNLASAAELEWGEVQDLSPTG